jgi:hypothetical protein
VCAPSGSGTIVCGEFAILRHFKLDPNASAVYVAPKVRACIHMRATCSVHMMLGNVLRIELVLNSTDICDYTCCDMMMHGNRLKLVI